MAIRLKISGNFLIVEDTATGIRPVNPFPRGAVRFQDKETKITIANIHDPNHNFVGTIGSGLVDSTDTAFTTNTIRTFLEENTGFNPATGGSVASDFDFTTVINETFSDTYDQSRVTVTNGTLTTAGGKLIVNCAQAEVASGSTLGGGTGITTAGITRITFNTGVYGKSIMTDLIMRLKVKVLTTPTSGRRYFGAGVDANGFKTPVDGGFLLSVSSTLANNHFFLKDQENGRRQTNQLIVANDELDIIARWRGSYVQFSVTKNGTYLGSYRINGSNENDNLARSCGQFCLYGWAMNFEIHNFEVIDVMPSNMDVAILGDSNTQGHGTDVSNYNGNWSRIYVSRSGKVVGIYGRSSLMLQDGIDVLHEPTRNLKKGGLLIVDLGTNDATQSRTLVQMQTDTQAIITAVNALGKNHKILFFTPPPISGSTSQNQKTEDFSQWLLATNLGSNVTVSNVRSALVNPSTIVWNDTLRNDLLHLNEEGNVRKEAYLKANNPELY